MLVTDDWLALMLASGELRFYSDNPQHIYDKHVIIKKHLGVPLFQGEYAAESMFRRFSVSPDGALTLVPTGLAHGTPCAHLFTRGNFEPGPTASYPVPEYGRSVTTVKFCPVVFELDTPSPLISTLRYKYVWAVAT